MTEALATEPVEADAEVDRDERLTPRYLFDLASRLWGPFTVDAAANASNALCRRFFDRETDGLRQSWDHERVWINPPFSSIEPWCAKAWDSHADVVVMLLPADRTERKWWHEHIEPFRDRIGSRLTTKFTDHRPRFASPSGLVVDRPKFGVVFAVWGARPAGSGA
jgi:site-specific DNA-methyltransferase (adenine-specific)